MAHRDQEVSPSGNARGGQAPALREKKHARVYVGRGPVPRHRSCYEKKRFLGP